MDNRISVDPVRGLEMSEIIEKLKAHGHEDLVECLLDQESDCYTKKGRLNKSATNRKMGWKSKQLEDALREMRELLSNEFDLDDEPRSRRRASI
jgi:hypothetical protein